MSLFKRVPSNIVQSIRAFHPDELQQEAVRLGQHFVYANCTQAQTRHQVLTTIARAFCLPGHFGRTYDALAGGLTSVPHQAGEQPGFVVVIDQLPDTRRFDNERRESLLDVFREASEFWSERKVAFRVFYSCSTQNLAALLPILR